jgi:hypothetical protein
MAKNSEQFKFNSQIHSFNIKLNNNLHYPTCNLTAFQKQTYYFGIKVFNNLPLSIKNKVYDMKQFKFALKRFLVLYSFYSLEEYFNFNTD